MTLYIFQYRRQVRSHGVAVIQAESKEEARELLPDEEKTQWMLMKQRTPQEIDGGAAEPIHTSKLICHG